MVLPFLDGGGVGLNNEDGADRRSPRSTDLFHPQSAAFFQMSFWTANGPMVRFAPQAAV